MRRSTPGQKIDAEQPRIALPMPDEGKRVVRHGAGKFLREKLVCTAAETAVQKAQEFSNEIVDTAKHLASISEKFHKIAIGRYKFTEEVALELLNRLARGETLKQITKDVHMPSYQQVLKWVKSDPDFQEAYLSAQEFRMNVFADEILEIADDAVGDIRLGFDKNGNVIPEVNVEAIQRSKLRIETRKYLMERYARGTFCAQKSVDNRISNSNGNAQVNIQINLPSNDRPIQTEVVDI